MAFKVFALSISLIIFPALALSAGLNQVKAVFLFNFFHYTNWSNTLLLAKSPSVNMCLIANDEFTQLLKLTVKDESIHNKPISVQTLSPETPPIDCHILFVSETKIKEIPIYSQLTDTLIISDIENSVHQGAMIELREIERKVKLFINLKLTKQANLSINSRLLSLATIVEKE